jgi:hypothetical protein
LGGEDIDVIAPEQLTGFFHEARGPHEEVSVCRIQTDLDGRVLRDDENTGADKMIPCS